MLSMCAGKAVEGGCLRAYLVVLRQRLSPVLWHGYGVNGWLRTKHPCSNFKNSSIWVFFLLGPSPTITWSGNLEANERQGIPSLPGFVLEIGKDENPGHPYPWTNWTFWKRAEPPYPGSSRKRGWEKQSYLPLTYSTVWSAPGIFSEPAFREWSWVIIGQPTIPVNVPPMLTAPWIIEMFALGTVQ